MYLLSTTDDHDDGEDLVLDLDWALLVDERAYDVARNGARQCTVCGCTDNVGCEDGCAWAQLTPPVCTRCAP
jgi:hypothetical protein